jgi:hypothetical protein
LKEVIHRNGAEVAEGSFFFSVSATNKKNIHCALCALSEAGGEQ